MKYNYLNTFNHFISDHSFQREDIIKLIKEICGKFEKIK